MSAPTPGKLIVIEGPDGSGKTDLCGGNAEQGFVGLADTIRSQGKDVLLLREPGGCHLSEHVRSILKGEILQGALTSYRAEALLFAAARAQLVEEVIRPALQAGTYVILDRYIGSSIVYQGLARGLSVQQIIDISLFATDNLPVDVVLALQVSPAVGAARKSARDGEDNDRIEASTSAQVIREGYANLKTLDPHAVVEVSADGSREQTLSECMRLLSGAGLL